MKSLPSDKATAGDIPVNVLKNSEIYFFNLTNCKNEAIRNNKFPDSLKLFDITPVYKKLDPSDKTNYRLVSVLPLLSKVFPKITYDQLYEYSEHFPSELLRGFRKAHSTQHLLNVFINNFFFFVEESKICNFAVDSTIYLCEKDLPKIKEDLICIMKNISKWFRLNFLKTNPGKFQFMILTDKTCYKHIFKINLTCPV